MNIEDLLHNSLAYVYAHCDICGKQQHVKYRSYNYNVDKNGRYVCQSCSIQVRHDRNFIKRRDKHYKRIMDICTEEGYMLLSTIDEVKSCKSYIRYSCPKHGEHLKRVVNFYTGDRCPECAIDNSSIRYKLPTEEVVKRVSGCGGTILNPEEYKNSSTKNLKFICTECGQVFVSSLGVYTNYGGQVCKKCSNLESLGEMRIRHFLENHNVEFMQEHSFKDCRDIHPLPFDFYLPNIHTAIEFDGRQHFMNNGFFKHSMEDVQYHDSIKNDYCSNNNIRLIRIPYTKLNYIEEILNKELFT